MHRLILSSVIAFSAIPELHAQLDWTQLTPSALPTARGGHGMAYDDVRDQVVLFGGNISGVGFTNDTWIYDGTTWTQVFPANSPPARAGHPLAYDPIRARVVLHGGIPIGGGALNDTWEWDGSNWTQIATPTPAPFKRSHPLVFHPTRAALVAWGGFDGSVDTNDTWEYNGIDWQPISTANAPAPRRASEMALDPNTGSLVLFSGYLQGADTWLFDGFNWRQVFPTTVPPARYDHAMCSDLRRDRVVMFGGLGTSDTWEWNGSNWLLRSPLTSPSARFDPYFVWDGLRQRSLMFGGVAGTPDFWAVATRAPASALVSGTACAGTAGAASVAISALPWANSTVEVSVSNVGSQPVLLAFGISDQSWLGIPLPLDLTFLQAPGCTLYLAIESSFTLTPTGGTASLSLPIPGGSFLAGAEAFFQGIVFDPSANALGFAFSNYLTATIGLR
ncbi:MAG: hypothetical protein JNM84_16105 [Planctomycetes bacterium]|nr:hypothetical protein [Planctomycetota bacterium]